MYLKRKIDSFLENWKQTPDRLPLIIRGPRQVGKTESILHFAKEAYSHYIYINFIEEPQYRMITENGYKPADVIKSISLLDPSKQFVPGKTLLIFDEIQNFPDIATSLKFFKLDGRFDVILSGSMLGLNYRQIESNSVGYKEDFEMTSMDFEEFLWAKGYDAAFTQDMLAHMVESRPFSTLTMTVLEKLFADFSTLGGMPAVVRNYIERGTFEGSLQMQRQLLRDYEEDVRKYLSGLDQTKVLAVFRQIPVQLAKENKKFQVTKIAKNARLKTYRDAIEWLRDAGIILLCYCLHIPELPLKGNYEENRFKIYMGDTGLLIATLDDEAQEDLRANKNFGVYKGALYENMVAEALSKSGYALYYYQRGDSRLEEDFFVRTADTLIPIEVKAGNDRSQSLRTLINSSKYPEIQEGIKFAKANIGYADHIHTFPYFCAFLTKRYLKER